MYILDKENNNLQKAEVCTFKSLKLEERKHLQEWIAAEPSSLGEDLLIVQKEFDGFSDTKERLDLLAIDKNGRLVIIENKLDDSGKDVTWQAIKYASYCSSLSKQEVIDIYAKYLNSDRDKAIDNILNFFDSEEIEDIDINSGENTQRIFFVAANFRKEVTSSVLWLSKFGLEIKCFKVSPFKYGDRILIDFDQIIPIKDAEDYTIKMAAKAHEANQASVAEANRYAVRKKFWAAFIEKNQVEKGPFATSSPSTDNWIGKSLGISGLTVCVVVNYQNCRVEAYFNFGEQEKNKAKFDCLFSHKNEIQAAMPEFPLVWERLDDKVTCRIKTERKLSFLDKNAVPEIMDFLLRGSTRFLDVLSKYNKEVAKA